MRELHMIGNAHLDPVWLWPWQEGYHENMATLLSAINRLEEYDDAVFTSSSAQFYEWLEENNLEMFNKIREYIQQGRWVLCGGWWVQPDCNLPGGESYVRHALLAQNFFKDKFGVTAKVGYNVDSFGHNASIPQLLKESGMDAYVFMRPGPHEKTLPGRNFIWESKDGSQVAAFRIPFTYCTFDGLKEHMEQCMDEFDSYSNLLMCFYGVGNHGGGPTKANIDLIHEIQNQYKDVKIVFSSPNDYFNSAKGEKEKWPVVHGELQHHASGCYSAVSLVKFWNRRTEHELLMAEKYASMDSILNRSRYSKELDRGWKNLLFNQFHDILAGSSIESAYEDAIIQIGESRSISARIQNAALQRISFNINIPEEKGMIPVVVFNPHSFALSQVVEFETGFFSNDSFNENISVIDSKNEIQLFQFIEPVAKIPNRMRIAFRAKVPRFGYETYRIIPSENKILDDKAEDSIMLENDLVKLVFDPITGGITSYYDKEYEIEYLDGRGGIPTVAKDESDTWSHEVLKFHDYCGEFKPTSMFVSENGRLRKTIEIRSEYEKSSMIQKFTLEKASKEVTVNCRVNWQEQMKCLKIRYPFAMDYYVANYEIPFGVIERETNGDEQPLLGWCDLSGIEKNTNKSAGMGILSDGKCSSDFEENCFSLTVLRSPAYAHHTPYVLSEKDNVSYTDQGIQNFRYRLIPHLGMWEEGKLVEKSLAFAQPLTLVLESYHKGILLQKDEFIHIDRENILLSAFKKADKSEGYIVRFYETNGVETNATIKIHLLNYTEKAHFTPNEIKTIFIPLKEGGEVYETNFIEWRK